MLDDRARTTPRNGATPVLNLTWLIPVLPLLAFVLIILFTHRNRQLSSNLAIGAIGLSWLVSWAIVFQVITTPHFELFDLTFPWIPTGTSIFQLGVMVDAYTAAMLFMVPFVCLMIFVYSQGYMAPLEHGHREWDPLYSRFFAYISLFAAGMLGLVVADNLFLAFISWEIMGLCSYLLIGFWYERPAASAERPSPADAGKKAFITTRVGDVLLFLGMVLLYGQMGTLSFPQIFTAQGIEKLAHATTVLPFFGEVSLATLVAILIFGGAVGKSAQFPLHVWLPDAMEGPTPVSALIHAATMVAAGVYLVGRTMPVFAASGLEGSAPLLAVAVIGAFTALFAATIGVAQNDIKRVLAYSTISQLGYMMMALGIGGFVAGIFHLITHAFFKALLFLGAGSVIIGSHHEQDMLKLGGLRSKMPITFITFLVGSLALAGIAPLAGFWSKDEILAEAFEQLGRQGDVTLPLIAYVFGTLAAFFTAFYMGRQIALTFFGPARSDHAEHARETERSMTGPLVVLAVFTLFLGFINIPENIPLIGNGWFHHFIGEVHQAVHVEYEAVPFNVTVAGISTLVAGLGLLAGWFMYREQPAGAPDPLSRVPGWIVLRNKYYIDEIYNATVVRWTVGASNLLFKVDDRWLVDPIVDGVGRFGRWLADNLRRWVDTFVIDGAVDGAGRTANFFGQGLRVIQTGRVQDYLAVVAVGVLALSGIYFLGSVAGLALLAFIAVLIAAGLYLVATAQTS